LKTKLQIRCGTYSNLVKQAQSKQKIIDKMIESGLTKKPENERYDARPTGNYIPHPRSIKFPEAWTLSRSIKFVFTDCGKLPPPVLAINAVSFAYSGKQVRVRRGIRLKGI